MSHAPSDSIESTTRATAKRHIALRILSGGVDLCLIALSAFGCYFAIQSGLKKSEIDFHLKQLAVKPEEVTFSKSLEDSNRIYVEALETGNPLEFAWSVYLPTGFKNNAFIASPSGVVGGSSMMPLTKPNLSIARFKIKLVGEYAVCEQRWLDKTTVHPINLRDSKETLEYLEQLDFNDTIDQVGESEIQSFSMEDDVDLLKLSVPFSGHSLHPGAEPGQSRFLFSLRKSIRSFKDR